MSHHHWHGGRSFSPRPMVLRATPVARETAVIPPYPAVLASAAARRRRDRSLRSGPTAANRSRIADVFIIQRVQKVIARAGISLMEILGRGGSRDSVVFVRRLTSRVHPPITFQEIAASAALCSTPQGRFRWIPSPSSTGRTREAVVTFVRSDPARPPVIFLVPEQYRPRVETRA